MPVPVKRNIEPQRFHPVDFTELADLRHTSDRWAARPFGLKDWQRRILKELFREKRGRRVYDQGLIGMARKNGKSELGGLIGLNLAFADGVYGAEVYAVAGDKDQARRVFNVAKKMVEWSPVLSRQLKPYRDSIYDPSTESIYRVVAADAPLRHGLNPSGVVFDELWNQPDEELWEAMTTGSGVRGEPLIVGLTTAGYDKSSLCYQLYERGRAGTDPNFYFFWAGLSETDDWRNSKTWKKANPALGDFLRMDYLERERTRLPEASFRRWHLNEWTSSVSRWISMDRWDACKGDDSEAFVDGAEVWVGIDGGAKRDTTAVVLVAPGEDGKLHVRARVFEPPAEEGRSIDPAQVEEFIREVCQSYEVQACLYDPAMFWRSAQMLMEEGYPMIEYPQTHARMCPASQALFDAVQESRLVHNGDRTLRAHADAAVARETGRGWRLDKDKATEHIDAMVALAMAVYEAGQTQPSPSVFVV